MLTKSKLHILTCFILRKQYSTHVLAYVPKHDPAVYTDIVKLTNFIDKYKNILILTGAGVSTESGIPDYRSEGVGLYARTNHKPINYQTYLKSPFARQRYWARNFIGWPKFSSCLPNDVHFAIQELEECQKVSAVVTQNVDNLHFKAKSRNVIELHGSAHRITCLGCRNTFSRYIFQEMLAKLNPNMTETATMVRPDGDVEIPEGKIDSFRVPQCNECGGIYKPDVVFFGDNVPLDRVDLVKDRVRESDALLVLGSTVTVFSSYRIVLQAKELNLPIAIVNIGQTRAHDLATLKISTRCGDILPHVSKIICR